MSEPERKIRITVPPNEVEPYMDIEPFVLLNKSGDYKKHADFEVFSSGKLFISGRQYADTDAWGCFSDAVRQFIIQGNTRWNAGKQTDERARKNPFRDPELDHHDMFNAGMNYGTNGLAEVALWLFPLPPADTWKEGEHETNGEHATQLGAMMFENATRQDILKAVIYLCLWAFQFEGTDRFENTFCMNTIDRFFQAFEPADLAFAKNPEYHAFVAEALRLAKTNPFKSNPPVAERSAWWYVTKPEDDADRFIQCLFFLTQDVLSLRRGYLCAPRGVYTAFHAMDLLIAEHPHLIYERLDFPEDREAREDLLNFQQDMRDFFYKRDFVEIPYHGEVVDVMDTKEDVAAS